jgi:hypothetical protein
MVCILRLRLQSFYVAHAASTHTTSAARRYRLPRSDL